MSVKTRLLVLLLALIVIAGGVFLSSFLHPAEDPPKAAEMKAPIITQKPEEVLLPTFVVDETPAPAEPEEPAASDEPFISDEPEESEEPAEPAEPAEAGEPAEPAESEAPAEPEEPEETPEPTPEPDLTASYFNDAAFIGDSISGILEYYRLNNQGLGKSTFLVREGYTVAASVDYSMMVVYHGREMTPQDALAAAEVTKVYIMLGAISDLSAYGLDKTMDNWAKLVANIREKCPDIRIFIQSCTPIAADTQRLTNKMIDDYNARLKTFAEENDCTYVAIGENFKDASGALPYEHCRDGFAHLRIDSAKLWVELLKDPSNYSVSPYES